MKGRSSPGVLPVGHAAFSDSPSAEHPRPRTGRTERPTSAAVASPGHRLHPTDERELVKRARGGDARARAKLVASHERARGISININYLPQLQEAVRALVAAVEARSQ